MRIVSTNGYYYAQFKLINFSLNSDHKGSGGSLNVDDSATPLEWSVYPNPAETFVLIKGSSDFNLQLMDLSGRTIYSASQVKKEAKIALREFPAGLYVLKLTGSDGRNYSRKLIIK